MSDTLGSLVDKLITTSMKLWFVQDRVHEAARDNEGLPPDLVKKLDTLNTQRNQLMAEIDVILSKAVATGAAEVNPQIKVY